MADSSITVEATAQGFKELYLASKDVDKKLATNLRRHIRDAAKSTIPYLQKNIRAVAQNANTDQAGTIRHPYQPGQLTEAMAGGIIVKISTGNNPSVTIREQSSALPDGKQMLARKWERKRAWRHPVYARDGATRGSWTGAWRDGIRPQPFYPQLIKSRPWFTWNMAEAMRETAKAIADNVNASTITT